MKMPLLLIAILFSTFLQAQSAIPSVSSINSNSSSDSFNDRLEFSIYPTPLTNGRLQIKTESTLLKHIQIYNILGEVVFETSTYFDTLELFSLDTGIYMFHLTQGDQSGIKRLVVP